MRQLMEYYGVLLKKVRLKVNNKYEDIYEYKGICVYFFDEKEKFDYNGITTYNANYFDKVKSDMYFVPIELFLKPCEIDFNKEDIETISDTYDRCYDKKYFLIEREYDRKIEFTMLSICKKEGSTVIKETYDKVLQTVKGQDDQVKSILSSILWNKNLNESDLSLNEIAKNKHTLLVMGPTGVGKTEIIRQISENIDIPVVVMDATDYTKTGYVGRSINDMLISLYMNANENLEVAQNSILVIDEFDKLAPNYDNNSSITSTSVQYELLTVIEGTKKELKINNKIVEFDTRKLTVILLGAFSKLEDKKTRLIGFNESGFRQNNNLQTTDLVQKLSSYGIEEELLGRINRIIRLNKMNKEILLEILKSENGRLMATINILQKQGVIFEIEEGTLEQIATLALEDGKGARSLNRIIDNIIEKEFNEAMFGNKKQIKLRTK